MRIAIVILTLLACTTVYSQEWHPARKKLKQPKSSNGYYITVAFFDKYDTIPCVYITRNNDGSRKEKKGYKYVLVHNGYYTDNASTLKVFYDDRMNRVYDVTRFYFD